MKRATADLLAAYSGHVRKVKEDYLPRRRVRIHVYGYAKGSSPDPDNLLKITLDALKRARLIVDDSTEYLDCPTPTIEVMPRGAKRYTLFTIEDLPNVQAQP